MERRKEKRKRGGKIASPVPARRPLFPGQESWISFFPLLTVPLSGCNCPVIVAKNESIRLSVSRVDYSELVEALIRGDDAKADELLKEILPRLEEYLVVAMGADVKTAGECVQQAFLDVFEQIRKGNIQGHNYIFSYLLKACRHEYLRYVRYHKRFHYDETPAREMVEPAQQILNLLDEERYQILKQCLGELDEESRSFILHFIRHPDTTTREAKERFGLSSANVRTRKSRITSRLHECYRRKSGR